MKRTCIAAALLSCAVASPAWAAGNNMQSSVSGSSFNSAQFQRDSASVRQLQEQLNAQGSGSLAVDGVWGPSTRAALQQYQRGQGFEATGRIDERTLAGLGINHAGVPASSSGDMGTQGSSNMGSDRRSVSPSGNIDSQGNMGVNSGAPGISGSGNAGAQGGMTTGSGSGASVSGSGSAGAAVGGR